MRQLLTGRSAVMKKRRKERGKVKERFFLIGTVLLTALFVLLVVSMVWKVVWLVRLSWAVTEVAAGTLTNSPTVPTVIRTRDALLGLARERGVRRPLLFIAIERQDGLNGQTTHVVAFALCTGATDPEYQQDLGRLLSAEELAALARERICEASGPREGHRHR